MNKPFLLQCMSFTKAKKPKTWKVNPSEVKILSNSVEKDEVKVSAIIRVGYSKPIPAVLMLTSLNIKDSKIISKSDMNGLLLTVEEVCLIKYLINTKAIV